MDDLTKMGGEELVDEIISREASDGFRQEILRRLARLESLEKLVDELRAEIARLKAAAKPEVM